MAKRCPFCGVDGEEPSAGAFLALVRRCNNCRVDIYLKGQWTGIGWAALTRINQRAEAAVDQLPTPTEAR